MNLQQISPKSSAWNKPKRSSLSRNAFIRRGTVQCERKNTFMLKRGNANDWRVRASILS
jgi:hypothetical protein